MARKEKSPKVEDVARYAGPFTAEMTVLIQKIMDEAPRKDEGVALYAMLKSIAVVWLTMIRQMEVDYDTACELFDKTWDEIDYVQAIVNLEGTIQ